LTSRTCGDSARVKSATLFTGHGADVMVQAQYLDAGVLLWMVLACESHWNREPAYRCPLSICV
jgi:hypothetical protein